MKYIEKLHLLKKLYLSEDDVIIEDNKGTDMKDVQKTIDWYEKIMSKIKKRPIR